MDSDEEFMRFSDSEKQSSPPIPERKLKRLRKATDNIPKYPLPAPSTEDDDPPPSPSPFHEVNSNSSAFEALDGVEKYGEEDLEELDAGNESPSESFKEGIELDSVLDSLDVEETRSGAKRSLEFDSVAEEFDAEVGDLTPTEVPVETKEKKKKRVSSADDFDDSLYSAASTKKMRNKERRERLKNLRAESQRLLRETRDASFKPVLSVQKSVSFVLEKIRQRKHELSKILVTTNTDSFIDDGDTVSREVTLDFDFENSPQNSPIKEVGSKVTGSYGDQTALCSVNVEPRSGAQSPQEFKQSSNASHKNETSKVALGEDSKQTFRPPVDDTQDLIFDSRTSDSKDDLSDEMPSSSLEDILGPSLPAMNLKLDSAPPDDFSSDEEDNDKENVDPCRPGSADLASSPKGDPVKAFVDDEAEEEDDSDNDLARFKDNEEDEDAMDSEEINDIIATAYEEKPVDNEMRNQLHQEWLEKQDAAGTENLLQRLKCRSKERDMALTEEEGEDCEDIEEGFLDDPAEYLVPRNVVRMNLKKAKEMICQMFTDKDDVYVSSDDEETEERLAKRQLSDETEEEAKFVSPAEDAGSKEIFGLIKKLNGVPDTRRRAKITSQFHTLSIGGNKTMSSKSSFLSKRSRNSLPSLQKHGPTTVRSFVFERDDSNSRSAIPMSEDSSDVVQIENRPKKTASAKYSSSQVRSSAQNAQTTAEKTSGPSLHEILKCQSLESSHFSGDSMSRQVEAIYASFKLDQTLVKKERGLSLRTA